MTVTGLPARHGPAGCERDNAALEPVTENAERFAPVDTAILFGGARMAFAFDGALLTLDSAQGAEAGLVGCLDFAR